MRNHYLPIAIVLAAICGNPTLANSGELLGFPPPDPPGTVVPVTPENVQKAVDGQLQARFEGAAGSIAQLLSASQANDAGWGFIFDHFAEIDRNGDGFVAFDDVQDFMDARAGRPLRNRQGAIQKIE